MQLKGTEESLEEERKQRVMSQRICEEHMQRVQEEFAKSEHLSSEVMHSNELLDDLKQQVGHPYFLFIEMLIINT